MEFESCTKNRIITSATTDSSSTSTDRDSSVPGNVNVHTNNGAIAGLQQNFYQTVVLPGRNVNNELTDINIIDSVTTKVNDAQQETEGVDFNDAIFNVGQIEEELTAISSARTVVTADTTLILDDPVNQYSIVQTQDHSDSQSVSVTIPMEATFSNPPVDSNLVTGKPSVESAGKNTEMRRDIVVPKLAEIAKVVWVHPQSELTFNSIYKVDQYIELPRLGDCIGGGGNGEVYKCFVKIQGKDQEHCFACKIEKKKPLYRKQALFKEICSLNDENHFVIIHAYLIVECQPCKPHPYGYIGYLLMEYFPLGSIADNLKKFQRDENSEGLKTLHQLSQEIEEIESAMREKKRTDDEFGRFRHQWCMLKAQKEKVAAWCQHILRGVMKTVRRLHEMNLLHLDIKDHNFLLRKTCEHKNEFICECDLPSFDILMGDFDYTQEHNSLILNPKSIGTRGYKPPHMESVDERTAQPCHDMYGSMVTIIRVACRMSQDHICMEILRFWEAMLLNIANLEVQLTELYDNLSLILSYIKKLENVNHFDNQNHRCNNNCEFFKNEIAFCARKLVMPPQHRFQYELTNQMMQFGSDALIIGYSGVFLTHGLSSLREDGVLLYMKEILTGTIEDCLQHM